MLELITKQLQRHNPVLKEVLAVIQDVNGAGYVVAAACFDGGYASWRVNPKNHSCNIGVYVKSADHAVASAYERARA